MEKPFNISRESQELLVKLVNARADTNKGDSQLFTKMEAIDKAYARFICPSEGDDKEEAGCEECGDVFKSDNIVAPIVVSQVDSTVAYLADVFLSGTPLFPVVSSPIDRKEAEQLETLMDDHSLLGGYHRQFLLFLKAAVRYNLGAIEATWSPIEQFSVLASYQEASGAKVERATKYFNGVKALDMYNTFWDQTVSPCDVPAHGDFAGYVEIITKTELKRDLTKMGEDALNIRKALGSKFSQADPAMGALTTGRYRIHPNISQFVDAATPGRFTNWTTYLTGVSGNKAKWNLSDGTLYEKVTCYVRILPSDYGIPAPASNTVQIWKLVVINGQELVCAKRIISAYDMLPILFGQPNEDFFRLQTQSIAEGAMPFQETVTKLLNIRLSAARRSVSDRALYDADSIDSEAVNSKSAAPKIPVRNSSLLAKGFDSIYKSIPFDMRGTETVIGDAREVISLSQELGGLNAPQRGQFQKGNKSVQEWNDTMGGSDNRLRLQAMMLEHQVFHPFKQMCALNIFQYGEDAELVSQKTGQVIKINIAELRRKTLSFRIADGYTPKAKLANTDMLVQGMNMLMNSPQLQQSYGQMLAPMFAHMMQLGGVRDMDQYVPQQQAAAQSPGLQGNILQTLDAAAAQQIDPAQAQQLGTDTAVPPTMPL